jgi:hypothetical protein
MWIMEGRFAPMQACAGSGDFFTVGKAFTDKKVLENQSGYTKKFIFP